MNYSHTKVGVICSFCGTPFKAILCNLVSLHTKSCGCLKAKRGSDLGKCFGFINGKKNRTHGLSKTSEYLIWYKMINRCYNKNSHNYKWYGGKGVKVLYKSFIDFYNDLGPRPSLSYSIDRINPNGNYAKGNCRWANAHEQRVNRRKE